MISDLRFQIEEGTAIWNLRSVIWDQLARPRTFPQHTLPLLPLLRSRPGGVHKACVVRSPGS